MHTFEPDGRLARKVLETAIQIQQIPAPTFHERERGHFVRQLFEAEGLKDVSVDSINNVWGRLPGRTPSSPLAVTAHLDTVFPGDVGPPKIASHLIRGPGIGDNALGVASLLGLAWMLRHANATLESDIWLVANSCEEGLGNLRGMQAVVDRLGREVTAYLVIEGTALGHVYHRAVGVKRFRVTVNTAGGHSWSDYGRPSAVHVLASLVTQLTGIPLPEVPRTTINVGTIAGGSGVNVLASQAHFELDVRSEGAETLQDLVARIQELVRAARRPDVAVEMDLIGQRPAGQLPESHPLVRLAVECLMAQGLQASLTSGSTDANIPLSMGIPAIVLGVTTGTGSHTLKESIDTQPVERGLRQLFCFVTRLLRAA